MEDEDAELGLGLLAAHALAGSLDVLFQLLNRVLERGPGVVNLVDDEDALAHEVVHFAQGREVEPLGAGDLFADGLNLCVAEGLVERQADGLNGDVGRAGLPEKRTQDAGRDVAAAANGNHELGLEVGEKPDGRPAAHVVHLESMAASVVRARVPQLRRWPAGGIAGSNRMVQADDYLHRCT